MALASALAGVAQAQNFNPIPLTQSSYTYGIVVAANAVPIQPYGLTATVGDGESGGDYTFFELGMYNFGPNNYGVPVHGTTFTNFHNANMQFQMALSYTANDDLMIDSANDTSGTLTLTTPTNATSLAFFGTGGNGGCTVNYTVTHADNGTESGTVSWPDWFNGNSGNSTVAWATGGRIAVNGGIDIHGNNNGTTGNNGQPYVYAQAISLSDSTPVVSVAFGYSSGGGYDSFFAVSASIDGTHYFPVPATGFNEQAIVPGFPVPITATMDAGTNISGGNPGTTWMEQGYDTSQGGQYSAYGLPPSGSTFASYTQPTHTYQMGNYNTNDAILIDSQHLSVNITPDTATNYGEIAFLTAAANAGSGMPVQCVIQHKDGVNETNTFYGYDWYDTSHNSSIAWQANGRVWMNNRTENNYGSNPRPYLFETYFSITDLGSPVTNLVANYVSGGGATYVLAVSGTVGATAPLVVSGPALGDQGEFVLGGTATFSVSVSGTPTITNTWLEESNGVFVPLANGTDFNGSLVSGANTLTLTISGLTSADATNFEYIASNVAGSATSSPTNISLSTPEPPPASAYKTAVLSYHPVGYWPLDETSGTIAFDYAGTNNGAYEGNYQLGQAGLPATAGIGPNTSVYFDGSTAYVDISSGGVGWSLNITNAITVMEWVQTTPGGDTTFTTPLGHGDTSYRLDVTPRPHFADDGPDAIGAAPINDGNWHQLVGVYDGTNEYLYADGNLVAGPYASTSPGSAYDLVIGAAPDYLGNRNFEGNIAQVAVFTNALTAAQIENVYSALEVPATLSTDISPLNAETYSGAPVTYIVGAMGSMPINYQWTMDGIAVSGATNASLTMAAECGTHIIQVSFTNIFNGVIPVLSSEATLQVTNYPSAITFNTNGTGWQINTFGIGNVPTIGNNVLELTDGNGNEASSAFYAVAQYVGSFAASFTYQDQGGGGADGVTFIIQNTSASTNALGGFGGSDGYVGISNSVEFVVDLFNSTGPGIALATNGANAVGYGPTGNVSIGSGDPINFIMNYADGIFNVEMTDATTLATYTTNYTVGSLTSIVGSDLAYVGFTGGDGGITSVQTITNFVFMSVVPPVSLTVSPPNNGNVVISWPAGNPNYELQTTTNLLNTWTIGPSPTETNGTNYVTITPIGRGDKFYRLVLVCQ